MDDKYRHSNIYVSFKKEYPNLVESVIKIKKAGYHEIKIYLEPEDGDGNRIRYYNADSKRLTTRGGVV